MKTVVSFKDDNDVNFVVEFIFNPGDDKFSFRYGLGLPADYPNLTWALTNISLVDLWDFRDPAILNAFLNWLADNIVDGVSPVTQVRWWDKYNDEDGVYPVSGIPYYPDNNRFVAFQAFMAQPRIKDPCKGWSNEELQGPYTGMSGIEQARMSSTEGFENLSVFGRAILTGSEPSGLVKVGLLGEFLLDLSTLAPRTVYPFRISWAASPGITGVDAESKILW